MKMTGKTFINDRRGIGNPYSIPKGGFVGEKKCIVMD